MDAAKRKRLERAGWRFGDAGDFLGMTSEERAFVEVRLALAQHLRNLRVERGWTQTHVAKLLNSSQSRVAKMESADATVSVDLLLKSLLALGASTEDVARVIAKAG